MKTDKTQHEPSRWSTVDKDLKRVSRIEAATYFVSRSYIGYSFAFLLLVSAGLFGVTLYGFGAGSALVAAACIFAAYLALSVGANDVGNTIGLAVGANALTLPSAICIAVAFESAGLFLAGDRVIQTTATGLFASNDATLVSWIMLSALVASTLWGKAATWLSVPFSLTQSIVGSIIGAAVVALGTSAIDWAQALQLLILWIVAPVIAGFLAALISAIVDLSVLRQDDKLAAALRFLPSCLALVAGLFTLFLAAQNGIDRSAIALTAIAISGTLIASPIILKKQAEALGTKGKPHKRLFGFPLFVTSALLCFAHGSNDLAVVLAPLLSVISQTNGDALPNTSLLLLGCVSLFAGLALFGPRLVEMVGNQITKLNWIRLFCATLAAIIVVLAASTFGVPVTTSHIVVGAIFGVGYGTYFSKLARQPTEAHSNKQKIRIAAEERRRRTLLRRSHFLTVVGTWIITLPLSAIAGAAIFGLSRLFS